MLPPRRAPLDEAEGLNVLVPGIMGIGFLISIIMLVIDTLEKALPMVGRRRSAQMWRLAQGRSNDLQSVADGAPPAVGLVRRRPRGRILSVALGLGALAGAILALRIGLDLAGETSVERQAWAAVVGALVALALAIPAGLWLLAAVTGPRAPAWLRWFHQYWPLGVLPDLSKE